ncbi:huntingtin, partial [Diaphorina citri]|uniref:Huntingtin n=1 Tax=Diaphorina citri TaxID=121845 RepID=A0A1S4EQV4_DIACI
RKEKISLCSTVTEMICSPNMKAAPNYSEVLTFAIESLLRMCNDNDSNVRMIADECLNKVIKAVVDGNIQKVLYELFKEMKKNDKARSLRAALWRFADLSHFIRPQKGRNYMSSLIPILINISARSEDSIVETLASSIPKIFKNLAYYATDSEIK